MSGGRTFWTSLDGLVVDLIVELDAGHRFRVGHTIQQHRCDPTTTIYEDFKSVNITTMKEAQSMAFGVLTAIDPEYLANGFILNNNGTNAFVDGTFSVAYPTP